jgi:hypothetical protein
MTEDRFGNSSVHAFRPLVIESAISYSEFYGEIVLHNYTKPARSNTTHRLLNNTHRKPS